MNIVIRLEPTLLNRKIFKNRYLFDIYSNPRFCDSRDYNSKDKWLISIGKEHIQIKIERFQRKLKYNNRKEKDALNFMFYRFNIRHFYAELALCSMFSNIYLMSNEVKSSFFL